MKNELHILTHNIIQNRSLFYKTIYNSCIQYHIESMFSVNILIFKKSILRDFYINPRNLYFLKRVLFKILKKRLNVRDLFEVNQI